MPGKGLQVSSLFCDCRNQSNRISMFLQPKPIVLIHGLWMSPGSWDSFRCLYEARGHVVLTPPWPRLKGTSENIRRNPSALAGLGITEIVDHYDRFVRLLD